MTNKISVMKMMDHINANAAVVYASDRDGDFGGTKHFLGCWLFRGQAESLGAEGV